MLCVLGAPSPHIYRWEVEGSSKGAPQVGGILLGVLPNSASPLPYLPEEYVFDMKKAIAIKLNDQYAKVTDGSCPSHHSPNDVIPLSNDNSCPWSGNLNHL